VAPLGLLHEGSITLGLKKVVPTSCFSPSGEPYSHGIEKIPSPALSSVLQIGIPEADESGGDMTTGHRKTFPVSPWRRQRRAEKSSGAKET